MVLERGENNFHELSEGVKMRTLNYHALVYNIKLILVVRFPGRRIEEDYNVMVNELR